MRCTFFISHTDFLENQTESTGTVNVHGALRLFWDFPFDEGMPAAGKRRKNSRIPTLSFEDDEGNRLNVWSETIEKFRIHYCKSDGRKADLLLDRHEMKMKHADQVPDFIRLFFKRKIEFWLTFSPQGQGGNDQVAVSEKDTREFLFKDVRKFRFIRFSLFFLVVIGLPLFFFDLFNGFEMGVGLHLLCSFYWLPGIIFHFSYWIKNHDAKLIVNTQEKTLEYIKGMRHVIIKQEDVHHCELREAMSGRAPWAEYCYLWIVLKNSRQIVVTNYLADPGEVLRLLKWPFELNRKGFPFLLI